MDSGDDDVNLTVVAFGRLVDGVLLGLVCDERVEADERSTEETFEKILKAARVLLLFLFWFL